MEEIVEIPNGVNVQVMKKIVIVKGLKGELKRDFDDPRFNSFVLFERNDNGFFVKTIHDKRKMKAFVGTVAAHVRNMIVGVTKGYVYKLKIFYTHFPITIDIKGKDVIVKNFLGEKSFRVSKIIGNTKIEIKKDDVIVSGINKEDVGQTAANIEMSCRLSGKDRRIFLDGVYITSCGAA